LALLFLLFLPFFELAGFVRSPPKVKGIPAAANLLVSSPTYSICGGISEPPLLRCKKALDKSKGDEKASQQKVVIRGLAL
jgi:hypothetical protein